MGSLRKIKIVLREFFKRPKLVFALLFVLLALTAGSNLLLAPDCDDPVAFPDRLEEMLTKIEPIRRALKDPEAAKHHSPEELDYMTRFLIWYDLNKDLRSGKCGILADTHTRIKKLEGGWPELNAFLDQMEAANYGAVCAACSASWWEYLIPGRFPLLWWMGREAGELAPEVERLAP